MHHVARVGCADNWVGDIIGDWVWLAVGDVVSDAVGVCDVGDWVGSIVDIVNGDRVKVVNIHMVHGDAWGCATGTVSVSMEPYVFDS